MQSPSAEDVISNLRNLSTSIFANHDRFEKYSDVATNSSLLPTIVVKMLEYLQAKFQQDHAFEDICSQLEPHLSNLKFLPVNLPIQNAKEYALVKPTQVLCMEPSEVSPYYPFLHPLIDEANSVIKLLSKIGVKRSFHLCHVQFVLESAKNLCQDGEVDFNIKRIILRATRELIKLLQEIKNKSDVIPQLMPLYLLSQQNVLTECSKLIVCDISHKFPPPVGYSYLNLFKDAEQQNIKDLQHLLPKELGLKSLRSITTYELIDSKPANDVCSNVLVIKEILQSNEFKKVIEIYSSCCNQGKISSHVTDILSEFQSKLTVQVLINVQVKPKVKIGDKIFPIDDIKEHSFFLHRSANQHWILSLKNTQDRYRPSAFQKLANQLCSNLQLKSTKYFQVVDDDNLPALTEFISCILQCSSTAKIAGVIKEYLPGDHDVDSFADRDPVLGDSMPERFHYMLDQCMFNIFYPEEWVGYEDEHGIIVCAQILHEVVNDRTTPQVSYFKQMMERRYMISLGQNETPIEVSALHLYKFIHNKVERNSGITEMDVYDGPSTSEQSEKFVETKMGYEKKISENKATGKKAIREAVKAAWELPEEQRKKAIKRLYLQYHPDKNPHNPNATAEFQFLQQEIERMEKGISEDEVDGRRQLLVTHKLVVQDGMVGLDSGTNMLHLIIVISGIEHLVHGTFQPPSETLMSLKGGLSKQDMNIQHSVY